jgi:hypothetical protein
MDFAELQSRTIGRVAKERDIFDIENELYEGLPFLLLGRCEM